MDRLEDLKSGARVAGILADGPVTLVSVDWYGGDAVRVVYEDGAGRLGQRLLYRADELALETLSADHAWTFDGDGAQLRLVSEAYRIRLAHLFDPFLAVHTSRIEPLPHQITAVYEDMLPRQPLRFLLADDPGAGKTIMTGLLIKELMVRGDLERCLIVAPGSLVEQWQDELAEKFGLTFDILTRDLINASRNGNPFESRSLLIARLDMMSRDGDLQARLTGSPDWDMVVVDEAHKMSAAFFGSEIKYTKRYQLGRVLSTKCRHFLLLTATPHSGKEADFQLFMALLDPDRFEGRFRDGVHKAQTQDLMRRMVKEDLLRFDGRPLFPERRAYTVSYELSPGEAALYTAVTDYVRDEMNRAERFANTDEQRRVNVGFALQTLQRRLASSPEAIYRSLVRRRERLEARVAGEKTRQRGAGAQAATTMAAPALVPEDTLSDIDDAPEDEVEVIEEEVLDQATAAATIAELETEIKTLKRLEEQARAVRLSGTDTKWTELNSVLDDPLMTDEHGARRKLIVFTEPRDTLHYLAERIRTRLGRAEAVVEIHGGVARDERRRAIERFSTDKDVLVMVANDAAGEGVNLQRAHLMVNYDLPWNPNRIEQRFGRIHRIGQREVCHLWNLVASETREGDVYKRLLDKLEVERAALGGRVYDVLGRLFEGNALRDLLMDAIRYGELPEVRERLEKAVDSAVQRDHLLELLRDRALAREGMTAEVVARIRDEMERAEARKLQPHYIASFFIEAFRRLGGTIREREAGRYEITNVPGVIRDRDRQVGAGVPVMPRYERVTFEKHLVEAAPRAEFVCPGHPLLDATLDLTLERLRDLLKRGAVLVDENDEGEQPRALLYLEHAIHDGRDYRGKPLVVSQRLEFVERREDGTTAQAGAAPYLDYRPSTDTERTAIADRLAAPWLGSALEESVLRFAVENIVPGHLEEVRDLRLALIDRTAKQVTQRLQQEIYYWDRRAEELKAQERAGKQPRMNSAHARKRADELAERKDRRLADLAKERAIAPLPPVIVGGALVIPVGLLRRLGAAPVPPATAEDSSAPERAAIERAAMEAVMAAERGLGREPRDVSATKGLGYDLESRQADGKGLLFIEVKGRWHQKSDLTLTRNEILCARNQPERWRLAVVLVDDGGAREPYYLKDVPFGEPDFAETTRTFHLGKLLEQAKAPH